MISLVIGQLNLDPRDEDTTMPKQTGAQYRKKHRQNQSRSRARKKERGLKQLNVWIGEDSFNKLAEVQKIYDHESKGKTVEWIIQELGKRYTSFSTEETPEKDI